MIPGSKEWLEARIAEHKAAQDQAAAQANAHGGAAQAYQRLLDEMNKEGTDGEGKAESD